MRKFFLFLLFGFIISLCFSKSVSAQTSWTKELEASIYNQVYNSVNLNFPNDSARKQFSICVVQKLKNKLPDGLTSIPPDSLSKLVTKIGIECKKELNTTVLTKWSPEFEKAFRKSIYGQLKKTLPESVKSMLCDCMITQYKKIYPQGMPHDIPIDVENKVLGVCYVAVMKNQKN